MYIREVICSDMQTQQQQWLSVGQMDSSSRVLEYFKTPACSKSINIKKLVFIRKQVKQHNHLELRGLEPKLANPSNLEKFPWQTKQHCKSVYYIESEMCFRTWNISFSWYQLFFVIAAVRKLCNFQFSNLGQPTLPPSPSHFPFLVPSIAEGIVKLQLQSTTQNIRQEINT